MMSQAVEELGNELIRKEGDIVEPSYVDAHGGVTYNSPNSYLDANGAAVWDVSVNCSVGWYNTKNAVPIRIIATITTITTFKLFFIN